MVGSSLERVRKAISHEQADCIPVGPFIGHYAAGQAGIKINDYIRDGRNIANAQLALWERLQQDVVVTAADTYYIAQAFGLEVLFHDDALPTAGRAPIQDLSDVARLTVKNPYVDGRMPVYLEAVSLLQDKLHGQAAIRGTGTGPFSLAAYAMGIQEFLTKLVEIERGYAEAWEERAIKDLLEIMSLTLIEFLKAQIFAGANIAYIGDSLASLDMISPEMYRKYAFPYHKKVIDAIRPHCEKYDAHPLIHICGNNLAILDDLAATGTDLLDIDAKMDLAVCKARIGSRICLVGNLDPVHVLLNGTPDSVAAESRKCVDLAGHDGGFILGSGCFVPIMTPLANLQAMVSVARKNLASIQ